ncbi:unnamed protein product, partial [Effrenium voratum]
SCERTLRSRLFQASFQGEAWRRLEDAGLQLELDEVFLRQWGLPYLFSLEGAVHAEEYVMPWESFEELAASYGLRVLADASFPDLLAQLKAKSSFYKNVFSKDRGNTNLTVEEENLFRLYSGFVLEREPGE